MRHLCAVQVRALIRAGASLDSQIAGGRARATSNWMCAGSTALHLACARGMPTVAAILLDAQAANPGAAPQPAVSSTCVPAYHATKASTGPHPGIQCPQS
jgi:hypothetical protein